MAYFIQPKPSRIPGARRSSWCMSLSSGSAEPRFSTTTITAQVPRVAGFGPRHILVPTDFSKHANLAFRYAIPFAQHFSADLSLLQVVQPPLASAEAKLTYPSAESLNQMSQDAREALVRFCEHEHLKLPSLRQAIVSIGSPEVVITEMARRLEVDLIILATHGRTGLAHMFFGSVAERVVREAPCPVLVLRGDEAQ